MRTNILARQLCALSKATSLLAFVSLATACSNDVMRMDTLTTASVQQPSNQDQIIAKRGKPLSHYGEEFGPSTPQIKAEPRKTRYGRIAVNPPPSAATIRRAQLPPVETPSIAPRQVAQAQPLPAAQPIVLQPRQGQANPLRIAKSDQMTTASVSSEQQVPVPAADPVGWNNSKGTWVTIKSGETLFNLSRRYGVPVSAIMSANNIGDGNSVGAGRQILIPTYNYSNAAPVSAPDNHPITKASRASRGFQGQPRGRIAVPKPRVSDLIVKSSAPNLQPRQVRAADAASSRYVVQSGDTLSGIAYRTGASVDAIRQQNAMSSDVVRLGQSLSIPARGSVVNGTVDPTMTGSIPTPNSKPQRVKFVRAPSNQTVASISKPAKVTQKPAVGKVANFRWPAEGRVISKFGQRSSSGTNDGIDISMPIGTPVKASQNGTVIYAGSELEDFGNLILVSHANGWVSAYAHASSNLVQRGQKVTRGQIIAKSGRTGNAKTPKLHFELRKDSNPVNPLQHLDR